MTAVNHIHAQPEVNAGEVISKAWKSSGEIFQALETNTGSRTQRRELP
jgi:hypothetical protein